MICDKCKIDRKDTDFINNQEFCYHCMYRIKLLKTPEKRTPRPMHCRVCSKEIIQIENLRKRQRSVFCSGACADKGQRELVSNHWTRKIRGADYWRK